MILLSLAAALVFGLCGAVGGTLTSMVVSERPGPTAPPQLASDFPHAGQRHLPKLSVAAIADSWLKKANSWVCEEGKEPYGHGKKRTTCHPKDEWVDVSVDIEFDDPTHVTMVTAECRYDPGANLCKTLFANMAHAVVGHSEPTLRDKAMDWGAQKVDTDSVTTIGGVRLETSLSPHRVVATPAIDHG